MLNTKQRAQLRAMANPLAVTLIIGKEGVTDAVERELDALLESHELVKGKVLESAMLTPRTVSRRNTLRGHRRGRCTVHRLQVCAVPPVQR